ncbi:MAG TPA: N-6 DNA methylase, partial [Salinivirgaceae bacterium]|nr:N-6 DNA methylase [Salinivirgaceae bacterium]
MRKILHQWKQLQELDAYTPLYNRFKKYFGYMNTGHKGKNDDVYAYNGGLFKPDTILDSIIIDDAVLHEHTLKLSNYDYASEVDVNILGHIFEHSLNELEEIKANLEGKEVDKSKTKRKKDGIYYTPKYITKYIVENTVGKLCDEKKQELGIVEEDYITDRKRNISTKKNLLNRLELYRAWLLKLTICDPACGSGAFLNQALDFLIKEHRYIDELIAKVTGASIVFEDIEISILENNLFGVDLNEESVEIAKLSLWLRTARPQRKLNDLNDNIKCGNSLIDDPEVAGDKAFNWEAEFPQVFAEGGFDVVIGNPPYGAELNELEKEKISSEFQLVKSKVSDSYLFFTLKMILLTKKNGYLGIIIPNTWMLINSTKEFRKSLLNYNIHEIIDYGDGIFNNVTVESITLILQNNFEKNKISAIRKKENVEISNNQVNRSVWLKDEDCRILLDINEDIESIISKLKINSKSFDKVAEIIWGIKPYQIGHGQPKQNKEMLKQRIYHSKIKLNEEWKPLLVGSNINRYSKNVEQIEYIKYGKNLMYPSNENKILSDKLLMRQTSDILRVVFDDEKYYPQNSIFIITVSEVNIHLKYFLSILNSKLIQFFYTINNPQKGKTFAEIKPSIIKKIPVKNISSKEQQPFIDKADQMLSLNKELQEILQKFIRILERRFEIDKIPNRLQEWHTLSYNEFLNELRKRKVKLSLTQEAEWEDYFHTEKEKATAIAEQIAATDRKIDQMVYKLYDLTDEEIEIVEKG